MAVIFRAESVYGQDVAVHAPDEDGETLFEVDNARVDFYLRAGDVQRLVGALVPVGAKTHTEWAARIHYSGGRPPADGRPTDEDIAYLAVEGVNCDANTDYRVRKGIDRAELVSREVHVTADGWTHTGPWTVVDTASKES